MVAVSAAALLALGAPAVNAASGPAKPSPGTSNRNQDKNLTNSLDKLMGSSEPGEGPVAETQETVSGLGDSLSLHGLLG
jgi:hypothetical protein